MQRFIFHPLPNQYHFGANIYSRAADCWELTREKSYSKSKCDSFIIFRKLFPQFSLYYKLYVEVIQKIFIKVTHICICKKFKTIQVVFENILFKNKGGTLTHFVRLFYYYYQTRTPKVSFVGHCSLILKKKYNTDFRLFKFKTLLHLLTNYSGL